MSTENIVINWASFSSLLLPSTQVGDFSLLMLWQVVYTFLKHSAMSNYVSGKQRVVPLSFQIWGFEKKHSDFNVSFRWFWELSVEGTEMKGRYGMRWGVMQVPGHRGFLMLLHVCPTFRKDGSSFKPSLSYCTQKQKRVDHKKSEILSKLLSL